LDAVEGNLSNISQRILRSNVSLDELERKVDALQSSADALKDTAINLQEANVEGKNLPNVYFHICLVVGLMETYVCVKGL
jgi:hypothetical protein